eukprot:465890-Prymnesium_polylepis.1
MNLGGHLPRQAPHDPRCPSPPPPRPTSPRVRHASANRRDGHGSLLQRSPALTPPAFSCPHPSS